MGDECLAQDKNRNQKQNRNFQKETKLCFVSNQCLTHQHLNRIGGVEDKKGKENETITATLSNMVKSQMHEESSDPIYSLNSITDQLFTKQAHLPSQGNNLLIDKMRELPR